MPAERYYIPKQFGQNDEILLEGLEFHHLSNVMRSKMGEIVELVNGNGSLAQAEILKLEKKRAILCVTDTYHQPKCPNRIILAQALPRLNRLDLIVEKGTELGMTELWLFPGERSERKELSENQLGRLHSIVIAALKQCGRLYLPSIVLKPALGDWSKPPFSIYFGDVSTEAPLLQDMLGEKQWVLFCTGPESGFAPQEEEHLKSLGATGVKLHKHILRTDTASLTALALITHRI